ENFRCCSLALQRVAQIVRSLAQFAKQAGVFDSDDGLGSEVLNQLDLLLIKGPHFLTKDRNRSNKHILLEHWHNKKRTAASKLDHRNGNRFPFLICLFLCEVRDLHYLLCACHAAKTVFGLGRTIGLARRNSANAGGTLCNATVRKVPSSYSCMTPNFAPDTRTAFASMVSNTGPSSPGELEITLRTSEVAVC